MATIKDAKVRNYCDAVDKELSGMKEKITMLLENVRGTYGEESEIFRAHERHLAELADFIDWKLQILMKACPFDWKGRDKDVESTVSVSPSGTDYSGGYVGG